MKKKERDEKKRWRRHAETALEGLGQALALLADLASDAGAPPWVGLASSGISTMIKMVQVRRSSLLLSLPERTTLHMLASKIQ